LDPVWPLWLLLALFTAAGLCALSAYIWRSRATEAGGSLVALLVAVAAWVIASGVEHALLTLGPKLLLAKLSWIPIVAVPLSTFVVAMHATGRDRWVSRRRLVLLSLPGLAMVGLVFTNEWHGWVWRSVSLDLDAPYPDLILPHGPAFWTAVTYHYALLATGFMALVVRYVREWPRNQEEAVLVSLAVIAPWAVNAHYLLSESQSPSLDLTPYAFSITAICLSLALWRGHGILNVMGIGRSQILDEMSDGALVVDARDRLVYANRAARMALGLDEVLAPTPIAGPLERHPDLLHALDRDRLDSEEISIHHAEGSWHTYDVRITTLQNFQGVPTSRVLVLRDVSESRRAQSALRDSEVLLRKVIDLVPHMVFAKDQQGELLLANKTMAEGAGLPSHEMVGGWAGRASAGGREFEKMRAEDLEVIRTGRPVHHAEVPWTAPDGARHTFEVSKIPFTDPGSGEAAMLGIAIDISERKRSEERMRKLAFYDTLTGLPNRQHFRNLLEAALESARRGHRRAALLFLDLDRFKEINDRLGHARGDALLRTVASRLGECVRLSDQIVRPGNDARSSTVSRLGGDEFTILLSEIGEPLDAAVVAMRIIESLAAPIGVDGQDVFTGASIGIAVYPDDASDADALFHHADQAMYDAKRRGRSRYAFFRAELTEASERRHAIEEGLHEALEQGSLALHYQLARHARSGGVVGAEALLRWRHPKLGPIGPREFVAVAEETGSICQIGEWVLRSACRQAQAWREAGLAPIPIAVNLSGYQLRDAGLLPFVAGLLAETDTSPGQLELEIVESTVMSDDDVTRANLRGLKEMGVAFALDDFGTGYSSLRYLRQFPFDCVKIDRAFVLDVVTDPGDRALTRGIIEMAHGLGLRVVAEGVETWSQLEFLRDAGCDAVQGHLIGEPVPADDLAHFLRNDKPD
jgi:diguanylate cyclase (GGDEF)-like protein/PAS domain S-box-containing protein